MYRLPLLFSTVVAVSLVGCGTHESGTGNGGASASTGVPTSGSGGGESSGTRSTGGSSSVGGAGGSGGTTSGVGGAGGSPADLGDFPDGYTLSGICNAPSGQHQVTDGPMYGSNWGAWRGRPPEVIMMQTYPAIGDANDSHAGNWQVPIDVYAGVGVPMVWTVSMLPTSDLPQGESYATFASALAGHYDGKFTALAAYLVQKGFASSVIRLGHEMSGDWYPWSLGWDASHPSQPTGAKAQTYAAMFQRVVGLMRGVPGSHLRFEWNTSCGWTGSGDPSDAYPGDSSVDFVGCDVYATGGSSSQASEPALWTADTDAAKFGLEFVANFAKQRGKRMAISEWGVHHDTGNGGQFGSGDDTTFVGNFHDWVSAHDVAYETIWNDDDSSVSRFSMTDHAHSNGPFVDSSDFPNAEALYKKVFLPGFGLPLSSSLRVSLAADRSAPSNLAKSSLTGSIYVFVAPDQESSVTQVDFYLDGVFSHSDSASPFDLAGESGGGAKALDTSTLGKGFHIVKAITRRTSGSPGEETAVFSVR